MTSYLRSLFNLNSKSDKIKYQKVATHSPPASARKTAALKRKMDDSSTLSHHHHTRSHKKGAYLCNRNSPTFHSSGAPHTEAISMDNSSVNKSDSELDDDDFPAATLEQKSLMHNPHRHARAHKTSTSTTKRANSVRHPWANKELSWWNHFSIGAYWFGWAFLWMPLLVIVIPHQIEYIVQGQNSGQSMGSVFLVGSIGSIVCSPVFGHLSDTSQNAMGRRRPFLMVGICITTMGLLLMSVSPPYHIYCGAFFICSCGNFITLAPYSALVPDVVPYDQRGICSGWLGACSMFGYLLGGILSYHLEKLGFFLTFMVLAMVHAFFGWITLRFVPEIHLKPADYTLMDATCASTEDDAYEQQHCCEDVEHGGGGDDSFSEVDLEDTHKHVHVHHNTQLPVASNNNTNISDTTVAHHHHHPDVDDRDPQFKNRMSSVHSPYPTQVRFFESPPFWNMDFLWLFISRFFIQMGAIIVQENLQYYLRDTKGGDFTFLGILLAKDEVQAVAVLFAPLLFGALISSIVSGIVSDIYGQQRKFLVYVSGTLMSICCILFGINRWFFIDIFVSLFFGFGFGIFSAIDWAMATDVLPNPHSYGRDMGYWNLSMTLPQVIGSPIVGYLIDIFRQFNYVRLGWLTIFAFCALNFVIGTSLVKKITHVK